MSIKSTDSNIFNSLLRDSTLVNHLSKYSITLGSQSPRRKELFAGLNLPFSVEVREVDEHFPTEMSAVEVPEFLASFKDRSI